MSGDVIYDWEGTHLLVLLHSTNHFNVRIGCISIKLTLFLTPWNKLMLRWDNKFPLVDL